MAWTQEEFFRNVIEALATLDPCDPAAGDFVSYFYEADPRIGVLIDDLIELSRSKDRLKPEQQRVAGQLMEKIAFLAFSRLKGAESFKSFQSAGPQYDLIVSGDSWPWLTLCKLLYLEEGRRSVIVEAKAIKERLSDQQFARACAIMENNLPIAGLGVFFTLSGASGFPDGSARQRSIRDCRLRQVLYHARSGRSVVVLDAQDIQALTTNGTFAKMLMRKIRDISELGGLASISAVDLYEVDLPEHLATLKLGG